MRTTAIAIVTALLFAGFAVMPTAAADPIVRTPALMGKSVCHPGVTYWDSQTNQTRYLVPNGCVNITAVALLAHA